MPIHDVGYRKWKGEFTATWSRWIIISRAGIRTALGSRWIKRILIASWLPVIYFALILFFLENLVIAPQMAALQLRNGSVLESVNASDENSMLPPQVQQELGEGVDQAITSSTQKVQQEALENVGFLAFLPDDGRVLMESLKSNDQSDVRHTVWSYVFSTFFQYSQGFATLMVVGLIVPPLISRDVRSRALLLYYSRPITRVEYVLGKLAIPGFVLTLITVAPAMVLYLVGVLVSPNLGVLADTWDLPFRIVAGAAVCILPTCLVGLLLSSLSQESRFAGFAWFTVWGLGAVVWMGIYTSKSELGQEHYDSEWSLISIYATIGRVQAWVFGVEVDWARVAPSLMMLIVISVVSAIWMYRRVSAPIRI